MAAGLRTAMRVPWQNIPTDYVAGINVQYIEAAGMRK